MPHEDWIVEGKLYIEHGEAFGLLENGQTVCVGSGTQVGTALAEPSKHRDMVHKLALVGVEIGPKEKDDGRDKASGEGVERRRTSKAAEYREKQPRLPKARKRTAVR